MKGTIVAFDDREQEGIVADEQGQRYAFSLVQWRGRGLPGPKTLVSFEVRNGQAVQVFNLPERQRRARRKVAAHQDTQGVTFSESRRYAGAAIAAIAIAMLGLFFDTLAPFVEVLAVFLALLALYQIRKTPERYKGRGLCVAAILLALCVATLSLLVEPAPKSRLDSSHDTVAPVEES
ncbi:hypothetical protein [Halomonas sp. PR-M31]|uniref:hypothetical protein n=1 Tax=Halomonas sp. PR-M31 TaxID=1471202 RepID=UPI000651011C|nr:hypothetical protein [Halomonas sp. PR-M31]